MIFGFFGGVLIDTFFDISVFWELFGIFFEFPDFFIIFRLFSFILLLYSNFCQAIFFQRSLSNGVCSAVLIYELTNAVQKWIQNTFGWIWRFLYEEKLTVLPNIFESFFTPRPNQGRDLQARNPQFTPSTIRFLF